MDGAMFHTLAEAVFGFAGDEYEYRPDEITWPEGWGPLFFPGRLTHSTGRGWGFGHVWVTVYGDRIQIERRFRESDGRPISVDEVATVPYRTEEAAFGLDDPDCLAKVESAIRGSTN